MRTGPALLIAAVVAASGCSSPAAGSETADEAAQRILGDPAQVESLEASLIGPFDRRPALTAPAGDCAVVPFVDTDGPFDTTLVLGRDDAGTWQVTDVRTGMAASADLYC